MKISERDLLIARTRELLTICENARFAVDGLRGIGQRERADEAQDGLDQRLNSLLTILLKLIEMTPDFWEKIR